MSHGEQVRFAAKTADITPERQLPLSPHLGRASVFEKVADRLEANVCVMRWRDCEAILVSADLLFIGDTVRNLVESEIGVTGRPEALFLAATHTHSAPMTQPGMPILGVADPEYAQFVARQVASAVKSIRAAEQAATVSYHEGTTDHSVHRRLKRLRLTRGGLRYSAEIGPNPVGLRDETVRLLKLCGPDGRVAAIVWNYACHPTDFPARNQVSADFPGTVRQRLRDWYGNIPVLYFQGFSGDVRPPFRRKVRGLKSLAYRILWGPEFGPAPEEAWRAWAESLAERACAIAETSGAGIPCDSLKVARRSLPLAAIAAGNDEAKRVYLQVAHLGQIRILGVSAEAVTHYRRIAEDIFGDGPLLTVNCLDQNHGYLPAESMLPDKGYEVEGFRKRFGFAATYKPGLEAVIQDQLTLLKTGIDRPGLADPGIAHRASASPDRGM